MRKIRSLWLPLSQADRLLIQKAPAFSSRDTLLCNIKNQKMRYLLLSGIFALTISASYSQISFKVDDDISYSDFRVRVGDDVSHADIRIRIGSDISYEDFTVGITSNKNQANFIISESNYTDYKIRAGDDVSHADLRIRAGDDVSYADLRIGIKKSGTVDYIVYTEKDFISLRDLVIALLPAINSHTDFEHDELNELFEDL